MLNNLWRHSLPTLWHVFVIKLRIRMEALSVTSPWKQIAGCGMMLFQCQEGSDFFKKTYILQISHAGGITNAFSSTITPLVCAGDRSSVYCNLTSCFHEYHKATLILHVTGIFATSFQLQFQKRFCQISADSSAIHSPN